MTPAQSQWAGTKLNKNNLLPRNVWAPDRVTEYSSSVPALVFIDNIEYDDPAEWESDLWLGENTRQWAVTVSPRHLPRLSHSFYCIGSACCYLLSFNTMRDRRAEWTNERQQDDKNIYGFNKGTWGKYITEASSLVGLPTITLYTGIQWDYLTNWIQLGAN